MTLSAVIQIESSTKTAKAADVITAKRIYGDFNEDEISNLGELKLGTDPNLSSTDGKIHDSKRYFNQIMSEEKLAEVNFENILYTLSVSAHTAGCIDEIIVYAVPRTASARTKTALKTVTEPHLFRMKTAL